MADYNFSEPNLTFGNLPFDTYNYTSSVCLMPQLQVIEAKYDQALAQADRIELAFYVVAFLLLVNVGIETVRYLKTRRMDE